METRDAMMALKSEILTRRADFPSLARMHNGCPLAYLDGPAGTQMPRSVIDAIVRYYTTSNANTHGQFVTAMESDALLEDARRLTALFTGASDPRRISFGANMTSLNFSLAWAIGRALRKGDEVLITQLDHEANRGPWLMLRERGAVVREIRLKPDATLDYDDFAAKVNERTRLVAMGLASNAFGTVNDVAFARKLTHAVGAWLLVDAVHYAPHFPLEVETWGVDFLLCSAYKFYGPHVGILYTREGLLEQLETDRLRTQDQGAPYRIETGTLNHAAIAGVKAAVEYIATFGSGDDPRSQVVAGMKKIGAYEHALARSLYHGLQQIGGVTVRGPSFAQPLRAPTVSFTLRGKRPEALCASLAGKGICVWDGNFYAVRPMEVLGLHDLGGVTRVGISLYNAEEEITRLLEAVTAEARTS
ncbi:MAG TPA: cysteine desulfurase-like protein [Bacteroidota bacterium]